MLIAYATDIGWSPYFPLISGIVTELGGLISHGNGILFSHISSGFLLKFPHLTQRFETF